MPEAAPLALLRQDIDRNPDRLKRVLVEPGIRKEIFGGIPNDEKKAIKMFVSQNSENALKTKPKVSETPFCSVSTCSNPLSSLLPFLYHE
jgi:Conserved hypothetical protein (DUF2461)